MNIDELEILDEQLLGDGGFSRLRRLRVRNKRRDGSLSGPYTLDALQRPKGTDAVVVLAYDSSAAGLRVLLRWGLRPCARLGRTTPTREGAEPALELLEAVAGILEAGDQGEVGLQRRAAAELQEETGLQVAPALIRRLGPAAYLSPGMMAERLYFCQVEAPLEQLGQAYGDGSALEEGGRPVVLPLPRALALCAEGAIEDVKTELALRRLAQAALE